MCSWSRSAGATPFRFGREHDHFAIRIQLQLENPDHLHPRHEQHPPRLRGDARHRQRPRLELRAPQRPTVHLELGSNTDVGFTDALLDELTATLCIDESRIDATGMSQGGHRTCSDLDEATLCSIDGGGHTWPSASPIILFGATTGDFSNAEILDVFARWRR